MGRAGLKWIGLAVLGVLLTFLCATLGWVREPAVAAPTIGPPVSWFMIRSHACSGYGKLVAGAYRTDKIVAVANGFVVAFSASCEDSAGLTTPLIGYSVFRPNRVWFVEEETGSSPLNPNWTISFGGGHGSEWSNITGLSASTVMHGLVQDPAVAWVQITFADGTVVSHMGVDKRFVFTNFLPVEPCKLRSLDHSGVILEEFDLSSASGIPADQEHPAGYALCD